MPRVTVEKIWNALKTSIIEHQITGPDQRFSILGHFTRSFFCNFLCFDFFDSLRSDHQSKRNPAALPAGEEPFNEHLPQLVHHLRADAALRFDLLSELNGERVGLEADLALFTKPELAVHFIDDVLGEGVFQIILK
jgi:hypothetical protein